MQIYEDEQYSSSKAIRQLLTRCWTGGDGGRHSGSVQPFSAAAQYTSLAGPAPPPTLARPVTASGVVLPAAPGANTLCKLCLSSVPGAALKRASSGRHSGSSWAASPTCTSSGRQHQLGYTASTGNHAACGLSRRSQARLVRHQGTHTHTHTMQDAQQHAAHNWSDVLVTSRL
jgi:hypothetical protein